LTQAWQAPEHPKPSIGNSFKDPTPFAEEIPGGPILTRFCKFALEHGVYITVPILEVEYEDNGKRYDSDDDPALVK
jgi:hypothetical protein